MKKIIYLILIILIAIVGCGKKEIKNESYIATIIAEGLDIYNVHDFRKFNNQIQILGSYYPFDDDGLFKSEVKILSIKPSSYIIDEKLITIPEGLNPSTIEYLFSGIGNFDNQKNVWLIYHISEGFGTNFRQVLVCFDNEGNYLRNVDIDFFDFYKYFSSTFNPCSLFVDKNTEDDKAIFYFLFGNELLIFDENGEQIKLKKELENHQIINILRLNDEKIIALSQKHGGMGSSTYITCFCPLECDQIMLENLKIEPFSSYIKNGNEEYELLLLTRTGASGFKLTGEQTELADWSESGVNNSDGQMYQYTILADDVIYCLEYGTIADNYMTRTINLVKLSDSKNDIKMSKKIVNVSTMYEDTKIKSAVIDFNRNNADYFINLKTYSNEGSGFWASDDAMTSFSIDVITGNTPDLVFLSRNMPVKTYANKGLFADLYEFIDNDPDISRDDYLPNIFELLETDGSLYLGIFSFGIRTLIGKATEFDNIENFAWNDFTDLLADKPDGILPMGYSERAMTKADFLNIALSYTLNDYINYDMANCSFESLDFINLLKTADIFPLKADDYMGEIDYIAGNPLLKESHFYSLARIELIQAYQQFDFGAEEITYFSSSCTTSDLFAIFADAKEKDGAWEFIKYFLTDFQYTGGTGSSNVLWGVPIKISAVEDLAEKARNRPDFEQVIIGFGGTFHDIFVRRPSEEYIQRILDMIYSLNYLDLFDEKIRDIILDEANYYFIGQKTPEEVAAIIQNRVSIYLAEIN
ncbi:MAG: extracellular solute-binding protein [Lachnospiraceae bacterium]|nr:extracellular solute-binding protein [Lachnospiraceae bacterium]